MYRKIIVLLFILLISFSVKGQKSGYVWCFGDSCLINFNTQPTLTGSSIIRTRGTACSISDSIGNLLFYCGSPHIELWQAGGVYFVGVIYNKNHEIMENGDTLASELWYNEMIIVPDPNNNLRYYLFHIETTVLNPGLYYSIIDLSFNGGLGKVISKNNQIISGHMADGISAVKNGNGRDWWVIVRKNNFQLGGPFDNNFYVLSVNLNGISQLPVQNTGTLNTTSGCALRFNPTGERFAFTNWKGLIELYDFDRCSGIISNPSNIEQELTANFPLTWSSEFSSSGQYLYVSTSTDTSFIYQYDLNAGNIQSSKKEISAFSQFYNAGGALKRGPDGKIYYALSWNDGSSFNFPYPDTVYNMYNMNLGVINQPDLPDTLCDFQPFSFYLGGKRNYYGLPNNPDYDLGPLVGSTCDTLHLTVNNISKKNFNLTIFPNPASSEINFYSEKFRAGELRVIDGLGKIIVVKHLNNGSAFVSGLESGVYYVQLLENGIIQSTEKFIIIE